MKRKIAVTSEEVDLICSALLYYRSTRSDLSIYDRSTRLASWINSQFIDASDPANDGPEVDILRVAAPYQGEIRE
jgi:hypothetical protein